VTSHVLLDTGPLVAVINRGDRFHEWARTRFGQIAPPLLTCEAVLAEACYLLRAHPGGSEAVLEFVQRGLVKTAFRLEEQAGPVRKLISKYATVPMSLADACLVRLSEVESQGVILTLDSDFHIYRRHGRQTIPLIAPEQE